ncbi:MAG TPA: hypothetical protein VG755_29885 [Nannocystaceae bacterium]|nr:hypothetical protein [Nannocystaceae bacterium]
MLAALAIATLFAYTLIMSQPLFFAFALGRASLALSGPAYAELRQRINAAITKPLVVVYALTFVACLVVAGVAAAAGAMTTAGGVGFAALTLAIDLVLAAKGNVPLNAVMNAWNPNALPPDWAAKREAWHRVFAVRRIVLCVGYAAFVIGAFGR